MYFVFPAPLARYIHFFFFNDTATTEIYTLSLHDALPLLIGVVQITGAPYSSQGRAYFAAQASIPTLTVLPNCLDSLVIQPGDTARVLVPFHFGAPLVAQAAGGTPTTLDCSDTHVISVPEVVNLLGTVVQYNATIAQAATARGWAYVDPNPVLRALAGVPGAILPFPAFPPDPNATAAPFGTAVSRDGVHPSTSTQRLLAQMLRDSRSEEHTSELQSRLHLVCRLLLEKKKKKNNKFK